MMTIKTMTTTADRVNNKIVAKPLCRQTGIVNQRFQSESVATGIGSSIELLRELQPRSPFRAPDWRWRLALHLFECPRSRLRRLADDPVRLTVDYLRQLRRLRTDRGRQRLAAKRPEIVAARAIRFGNQVRRHEVEARLLAAQTDHEIADRFVLQPEAVALYERLFFDVRARLDATSYIHHTVIGPIIPPGRDAPDRTRLLKLLAVRGGPAVLDVVLDADRESMEPAHWTPFTARDPRVTRRTGMIRLVLGVLSLPVSGRRSNGLLSAFARTGEIERGALLRSAAAVSGPVAATCELQIGVGDNLSTDSLTASFKNVCITGTDVTDEKDRVSVAAILRFPDIGPDLALMESARIVPPMAAAV